MKNINLYYFHKRDNFGDLLNTYIPSKLFNCNINKVSIENTEALFIGSILTSVLTKSKPVKPLSRIKIWGTGFIQSPLSNQFLSRGLEVFAVRGKYTKELLEKMTHKKYDIPLGDPGLLCSKIYSNEGIEKEYDWGIIPHYIDKNNENLKKLQLPNSIILDITEQPEVFLSKLVKCKKVISSAMHGLIAADSYCIPSIRMILSDKIVGGDFKYNDYYSAFDISIHNKIDLRTTNGIIKDLSIDYQITPEKVQKIQNDLIKSFPYA